MNDDDDLTGIFDHLTPDDFLTQDLSAQHIDLDPATDFDQFLAEQLKMLKFGFAASDGEVHPLTVLATNDKAIVYQADDDETLGQYIDRMQSEARRLKARWVFFYKKTLVSFPANPTARVDNADLINHAAVSGEAWEAVYWYAARNDGGEPHMRHGYIKIDGNKLGKIAEAPIQTNELLERILG